MADEPGRPVHPLGADAPTEDYVGLAFRALLFSVALGTGVAAVVSFTVRSLQLAAPAASPAEAVDLGSPAALVLLGGTGLALLAAALATWRLLAPIRSPYRQGMLAAVSAFGTMLVSLVTLPADRLFGRPGLAAVAALAFGLCLWIGRGFGRNPA